MSEFCCALYLLVSLKMTMYLSLILRDGSEDVLIVFNIVDVDDTTADNRMVNTVMELKITIWIVQLLLSSPL